MGRRGIGFIEKIEAVEKYKRGEGSQKSLAREYRVRKASFQQWTANYDSMGPSGLAVRHTNNEYSVDQKTAVVEAYLRGEGSQIEICRRYSIRSTAQLRKWMQEYKGQKGLRATGQGRWIHMTKGRTITLDERIEIVTCCIAEGKNYGAMIEK